MLSYQLYASRNFPPLGATLAMLADLGYDAVEGYSALYADDAQVAALTAALGNSGLAMPTGHFGLAQIESEPDKVLAIARALGIGRIYCPYLMPDDRPTDAAGWRAFGARLQAAGRPIKAAGLGFGWHNHDFELRPLPDGQVPQDLIFDGGPDLEWEIDVAWVVRGGADPAAWIARYAPRITAAHLKDIAPAGQNAGEDGWADLGTGTVPWTALMAELRQTPCDVFIVEHDNPSDHARFARRSLQAAKGL
ncbi:MAG: sugar phosphate isomerase/epimerase [Rhodobacter sp.]|nr:sugar phosphate isomerase/epimerase [Rhodobacter sp.]MCA3512468.1 sugar phosphate isomerase/epimerase [Rhodobacter sp.]MCA3519231.1 sugar phosphate isomerase/epimerase [Rhodobacter sp.]MCA3523444.1 sugar phosphate isomerase/epimerase [Rhodobacter sp.]MCA3526026.1 sugar phosphate isomerase/epimerase [Rhodobacter sp.]